MAEITEEEVDYSSLDAHLKEMPSKEWWTGVHETFDKLLQLIQPTWMREPETKEELDEYTKNSRMVREGSLPFATVLSTGNHALGFTATNEPLECIAFGTMGAKLFIELFWEAVNKAQDAGEAIVVHEVQSFVPRIVLSLGAYEFEMRYVQCETLIRKQDPRIFPSFMMTDSIQIWRRSQRPSRIPRGSKQLL